MFWLEPVRTAGEKNGVERGAGLRYGIRTATHAAKGQRFICGKDNKRCTFQRMVVPRCLSRIRQNHMYPRVSRPEHATPLMNETGGQHAVRLLRQHVAHSASPHRLSRFDPNHKHNSSPSPRLHPSKQKHLPCHLKRNLRAHCAKPQIQLPCSAFQSTQCVPPIRLSAPCRASTPFFSPSPLPPKKGRSCAPESIRRIYSVNVRPVFSAATFAKRAKSALRIISSGKPISSSIASEFSNRPTASR